jgi:hypothetical protein
MKKILRKNKKIKIILNNILEKLIIKLKIEFEILKILIIM